MSGRVLVASFDPDEDARPRRKPSSDQALEAGGFVLYERFIRRPDHAAERWPKLSPSRRQMWIDDFAAGLSAYRAAGGR